QAPPHSEVHHLLGHPVDLPGHLAAHGPLNVALGRRGSWQEALAASLESSGLGGRGGGGFPASVKLAMARSGGKGGSIVVNAMEGEPASDKDKVLLAWVPHLVLDGAQYLATVCRADRVVVCVPAGRDAVAASVQHAIAERGASRYARVPEVVSRPPELFVAGEESALVNWIDTGRALPEFRPDKSSPLRIGKRPVLVHNTETLAHIALIARHGPDPFRSRGMPEEPGTCLVTITGAVTQPGVVEIDRGTPLVDIAMLSRPFGRPQALLVGGYGGSWVGPEHFAMPYASISLRTIGASAGVGVLVVLSEDTCGVAETAHIARYLADQSAGQCGPCVFGLPAIAEDLTRLAWGQRDPGLMSRLLRRLAQVHGRGACRHPDGAVAMVRSALAVFSTDVAAHERGRPCAAYLKPTQLRLPRRMAAR
ncbi:MAG: NADH-ubiquinone oxidoreductase-F iron-sulfur binding region domain-containing protein, partial [Acidimicrobiales bacterium]